MSKDEAKKLICILDTYLIQHYPIKQGEIDDVYQRYLLSQFANR